MLKDQRLDKIEEYITINQYASLTDLMNNFGISKATVRRDLKQIEENGRVIVTRGGALAVRRGTQYELPYLEKRRMNHEEKVRIAQAASGYVKPGDTVFIDSGTTGAQMPPFLSTVQNVCVATNDLMTAVSLVSCSGVSLIMIGGSIRKGFYTAYGYYAAENVEEYHFDKAFLSLDAISVDHGGMITNAEEVDIKRAIIKASEEVIVICDHTKFEVSAFISICPITKISRIITGRELDTEIGRKFTGAGVVIEAI